MELSYNVEATYLDIHLTKGDTIDMSFSVAMNDVAYDLTGMQIDFIIKNRLGVAIKTLSSAGGSSAITIYLNTYTVITTAITTIGIYKYDVQVTDGSNIMTIQKGNVLVTEEIT
jgi:hypothetical protein